MYTVSCKHDQNLDQHLYIIEPQKRANVKVTDC